MNDEGDANSMWLLEPVRVAYEQAVAELRLIARQGEYEASIVLDAATGQRLDSQLGDRHRVAYDPAKCAGREAVVALHVHVDESPLSGDDWDVCLLNPEIRRIVAVTPTHAHILEKPNDWSPQAHKLPTRQGDAHPTITPFALFIAYAKNLKRRHGIADTVGWEDVPEETRNAIFVETNEFLESRFGVIVKKVKLP